MATTRKKLVVSLSVLGAVSAVATATWSYLRDRSWREHVLSMCSSCLQSSRYQRDPPGGSPRRPCGPGWYRPQESSVRRKPEIPPRLPWAVPVVAIYLWVFWRYLQGAGPPASSAQFRTSNLRARALPMRLWGWSLLAGTLGIIALVIALQLLNQLSPCLSSRSLSCGPFRRSQQLACYWPRRQSLASWKKQPFAATCRDPSSVSTDCSWPFSSLEPCSQSCIWISRPSCGLTT